MTDVSEFKKFFEDRNFVPFPGLPMEDRDEVLDRLMNTVAEFVVYKLQVRQPTQEMVAAGVSEIVHYDREFDDPEEYAEKVYRAMEEKRLGNIQPDQQE